MRFLFSNLLFSLKEPVVGDINSTNSLYRQKPMLDEGDFLSSFFFLYILPNPLSSIIGRCTLYTPGCRMKAYK